MHIEGDRVTVPLEFQRFHDLLGKIVHVDLRAFDQLVGRNDQSLIGITLYAERVEDRNVRSATDGNVTFEIAVINFFVYRLRRDVDLSLVFFVKLFHKTFHGRPVRARIQIPIRNAHFASVYLTSTTACAKHKAGAQSQRRYGNFQFLFHINLPFR